MVKIIGSGSGVHSPEFHKKKRRETYIKRTFAALILAVVIGVPIYVSRMQKLLISSVEVSGNEVTKSADIEKIIADDLSGNYMWIFPKSNTFIYPKGAIIKDLLEKEPRLSSVVVAKPSLKSLKVVVTERSAVAEYCKNVSDPSAPEDCYFLDDTGYIFAPAPAFSGNVYHVYATAVPYENPVGQTILDADTIHTSLAFIQSLGGLGIYPRIFLISADEYHLLLSNGAEIMWSTSSDFATVLTNLESFFTDKSIKSDPTFLSRVAYIDMRFGNKIFYKFRE